VRALDHPNGGDYNRTPSSASTAVATAPAAHQGRLECFYGAVDVFERDTADAAARAHRDQHERTIVDTVVLLSAIGTG
jgi:hypothetical protein